MAPISIPYRLVLASRSPRRRELLDEAGYAFDVMPASDEAECGLCSGETPPEFVARLARQKAADVAARLQQTGAESDTLVIGCDTVAECLGQILGKPQDLDHARQMLTMLRGREHRVFSGLCLWPIGGEPRVQVAVTQLRMDDLPDGALEEYLDSGGWEGKAGAFGYQDRLGWVHVTAGSESNVVGLPLELFEAMLRELT